MIWLFETLENVYWWWLYATVIIFIIGIITALVDIELGGPIIMLTFVSFLTWLVIGLIILFCLVVIWALMIVFEWDFWYAVAVYIISICVINGIAKTIRACRTPVHTCHDH